MKIIFITTNREIDPTLAIAIALLAFGCLIFAFGFWMNL